MKPDASCPAAEEIRLYVSGKLNDGRMTKIESHLESCETCNTLAARIEQERPDSLALQMKGLGTLSCSLKVPDLETEKEKKLDGEIKMPKSIGVYEITGLLDHGGMGVVYEGFQPQLKRKVAVKVVKPKHRFDPEMQARFQRELEAVGRLEHHNIVRAYDAGEFDGRPYFVTELLDGNDLAYFVSKSPPLSLSEFIDIGRQIVAGLQYAHEKGFVHRDIKPSNIFLTKTGVVKLLDFGLAKPFDQSTAETPTAQTASDTIVGTSDFMAPEQIEHSATADHRADIYSLGCTLYFLLTGQAPFTGSQANVLAAHLRDPFPSVRTTRPELPTVVDLLLQRMAAKNPDERFQNAEEIDHALQRLATHSEFGTKSLPLSLKLAAIVVLVLLFAVPITTWAVRRNIAVTETPPAGVSKSLPVMTPEEWEKITDDIQRSFEQSNAGFVLPTTPALPKSDGGTELLGVTTFSNGYIPDRRPWTIFKDESDKITARNHDGNLVITTGDNVSGGLSPQLVGLRLAMKRETFCRLEFEMKSSRENTIRVVVRENDAPFRSLGLAREITVTPDWETFTFEFVSSGTTKGNIVFNQFQGDCEYQFRRISLRRYDDK